MDPLVSPVNYSVFLVEDDTPTRDRLAPLIDSHEKLSLLGAYQSLAEARGA